MEKVSEAILKRIRALLAMSRGNANENEAAIAGQKVQELLAQYNLDLSAVEKEGARIVEDNDLMTSSSNPWRRDLGKATALLYLCDYYWNFVKVDTHTRKCGYIRGDRHNFIGLPHNVVVAKEMFVYFVDTVERLAKDARKTKGEKHTYEHAFRTACGRRLTQRILERWQDQSAPPAGLVTKSNVPALYMTVGAEATAFMDERHRDLTIIPDRGKTSNSNGFWEGREAANGIPLDAQLEQESPLAIAKS